MRPDLQQDPRPEFGIPVPRDAAGRHDDTAAGPQAPWSGPQPAAPWSGPTPTGPYSGGQPAVGPYSGPQMAAPRTGGWPAAAGPTARQAAEPTVRHAQPEAPRHEPTAYDPAPAGYEPVGYTPAGYDPRDGHPSGPLPVGSGHRRGGARAGTGRGKRRVLLALVAAGAVVAGAAGYVAIAHWGNSSGTAAAPAAAPAAATTLTGPNLATRETPLGLVATSDGYTVYEYTKDSNKPSAATCSGGCATAWPPVLAGDTPWLKGVNPDKVGTVDRPDGTKQLTLNGWPLYRYAKDTKPGETTGNGVGGTWKALNPEGKPVAPNAPAAGGTAPAAGGPAPAAAPKQGGADADGDGAGTGAAPAPAAPAASGDSYVSSGY